jgi:hypothetical protein
LSCWAYPSCDRLLGALAVEADLVVLGVPELLEHVLQLLDVAALAAGAQVAVRRDGAGQNEHRAAGDLRDAGARLDEVADVHVDTGHDRGAGGIGCPCHHVDGLLGGDRAAGDDRVDEHPALHRRGNHRGRRRLGLGRDLGGGLDLGRRHHRGRRHQDDRDHDDHQHPPAGRQCPAGVIRLILQ